MRRAPLLLGLTLCLAALMAFAAGCNEKPNTPPTPPPPEVNSTPPTPPNDTPVQPASADQRVFEIDPDNSSIMWNATVPIGTREGGWTTFTGTVEMNGDNIETAKINVTVDMTSAYSDAQELTDKLKGEDNFFNPIKYPTSTFKSASVKKTANGYEVTGDFTVRDVTKSFTFPAEIEVKDGTLTAKAKFDMNRQDFGITYQSTIGDYIIKDMCPLILDIVAKEKTSAQPPA